jgi:hypothetical protein
MPKTYKKLKKRGGVTISRRNRPRAEQAFSSLPRPSYRRPTYSRRPYQNVHDNAIEEENNDAIDVEEEENYDPMDVVEEENNDAMDVVEEDDRIPRINLEQDCQTEERSPGVFESGISYETLIPSQTVKLSDGRCYSFQDVVNLYNRAGSQANFKSPYTRILFTDADYDIVMELMARGIQPDQPYREEIGGYRKNKKSFSKKNKKSSKKNKKTTKKRKTTKRKRS